MASPTIQFKRGQSANVGLASFKAGEPGFTTDKYDFYIGLDGTADNQKFFGSSRYWEREDGSSAAQLKFVDKNGTNSINFQAPNTLAGIGTWILPDYAAGSADQFLKITSKAGNQLTLDWATVITTFDIAADSGTNDEVSTGSTITFVGGEGVDTTVSDNEITIAAEIATASNAGIASFPASTFFFNGPQVGVVTATDSVKGIASFDETDFVVTDGDVALQAERIEDIVGAQLVTNGSHTRITATYDDANDGAIDLVVDNDLANYDNSSSAFITASSSDTLTNKTFDANGTGNSISNIEVADFAAAALVIESEGIGSNDNDTTIPTSAAVKDYVDTTGVIDISGDTGTASVSTGATFAFTGTDPVVIVASGAGVTFSISDASTSAKGIASFDNGDFGVTSGAVALSDTVVKSVSTDGSAATPSGHSFTIAGTSNEIETSGSGATVTIGLPDDVTIANNLTVTNNLFVNGSTTQVNVDTLTVDDPLIAVGTTAGGAPAGDFAKDLGILMHYYSASAKLASVYWDNSAGRMVMADVVTESNNVLTATSHATVEIGSLMLSDAAGTAESVITVSGSDRVLQNILVDAGTF